jgi:hypothetical protein
VKLFHITERPSELVAACAQVLDGSGWTSATTASLGYRGHVEAKGGLGVGASLTQAQRAQNKGTSVPASALKAMDVSKITSIFGDVRGIPPRGRPV